MLNHQRWIAAVIATAVICVSSNANDLRVLIRKGPVSIESNEITVGSIALVTGGDMQTRILIESLDLDVIQSFGAQYRIDRRQVELRILLSGVAPSDFRVLGSERVYVQRGIAASFQTDLENEISTEITRQFGFADNAANVQLLNKRQVDEAKAALSTSDFATTIFLPPQAPIGKTRLRVDFIDGNRRRFSQTFDAEVVIEFKLAVAVQPILRGTKIDSTMLREVSRPVSKKEQFVAPHQVVGMVAKRDIQSNQVLLTSYLGNATENRQPVVRRQRPLDVVIKVRGAEFRLKNAKALEDGRVGDLIAILNTRSGKRLYARVIGPSLAVIDTGGATK